MGMSSYVCSCIRSCMYALPIPLQVPTHIPLWVCSVRVQIDAHMIVYGAKGDRSYLPIRSCVRGVSADLVWVRTRDCHPAHATHPCLPCYASGIHPVIPCVYDLHSSYGSLCGTSDLRCVQHVTFILRIIRCVLPVFHDLYVSDLHLYHRYDPVTY